MVKHKHFPKSILAVAVSSAISVPALAFQYEKDDFRMQVDSTVSVGASWRASDRDYEGVGTANATAAGENGHLHGTSSQDNSNLLWKKGSTFSEIVKLTVDLEMNYKNYGAFVRGKAFYDHRIVNGDGVTDLPEYYRQDSNGNPLEPHQSDGRSADILDAFVWGDWWINDKPLNVRLGKQVISWGEGLFFANGINSINPVDVQALLAPGSEVKDALIPLNALHASFGVTDTLTLEAFVLFDWEETQLPPCGTYFSTTDLIGDNCYGGFYPSGEEATYVNPIYALAGLGAAEFRNLPQGDKNEPDDDGQFGFAARYFAESIETEFAVYYIKYHSRLPVLSGHMPVPDDLSALVKSTFNITQSDLVSARAQLFNGIFSAYSPGIGAARAAALASVGGTFMLPTADIFVEYPEDIELLGLSFNTSIDFGIPGGATAVSGEISVRKDQPFMMEDGDTLAGLLGLPAVLCHEANYDCYALYDPGDYVKGYVEEDYYQAELTFIHFFDRILGAERWSAVFDLAGSYVNIPDKDEAILNSSYNATLNHPWAPNVQTIAGINTTLYPDFLDLLYAGGTASAYPENSDYYPTKGAWGYKMRFTGEYSNVFAGINLKPSISFSHDVYGVTPSPISNFLEDRKALGLSLEGIYQNTYSVTFAYTDYYGAQPYNQLADRDYYSLSASASF